MAAAAQLGVGNRHLVRRDPTEVEGRGVLDLHDGHRRGLACQRLRLRLRTESQPLWTVSSFGIQARRRGDEATGLSPGMVKGMSHAELAE